MACGYSLIQAVPGEENVLADILIKKSSPRSGIVHISEKTRIQRTLESDDDESDMCYPYHFLIKLEGPGHVEFDMFMIDLRTYKSVLDTKTMYQNISMEIEAQRELDKKK